MIILIFLQINPLVNAESKALVNENYFYGLPIDQDNEDELTLGRLEKWVEQLKSEIMND